MTLIRPKDAVSGNCSERSPASAAAQTLQRLSGVAAPIPGGPPPALAMLQKAPSRLLLPLLLALVPDVSANCGRGGGQLPSGRELGGRLGQTLGPLGESVGKSLGGQLEQARP